MRNGRKGILALIILLAVCFAAVTTTLVINGTSIFGANSTDFDVYFSKAVIDETENNSVISQNGKSITYETANLEVAGDTSELEYTVTNNSSHYDAKVSIECDFAGNEYVILENSLQNEIIEAKSEEIGTLTATLIKTSTEERNQNFVCIIIAEAVERETIATDPIIEGESNTYSLYGYLVDENDEILPNYTIVVYNTPHQYTVTEEDGYLYVENLEKGSHTIYILENITIDDVENLSEEEIETQAITSTDFTTNAINIVFPNGYRIVDLVIEKTRTITVSFDPNGVDTVIEDKTYRIGKDVYGEFPELTRENYTLLGWFNEEDKSVSSTERVNDTTTKITAKWEGVKSLVTLDANGGTVTPASIEVTYGDEYPTIPTATKEKYKFLEWQDEEGIATELSGVVTQTSDVTLTATWAKLCQGICEDQDDNEIVSTGDIINLSSGISTYNTTSLGTERFYLISDDDTNIKMLSMYNLYVGGEYSGTDWIAYTNPTGIQDSTMKGYNETDDILRRGVTVFSSSSQKGTNYSDYEGSIVEIYVNNYSDYLRNTLGVENTATLISKEEIEAIVGQTVKKGKDLATLGAPEWLYSTTYWTRTAVSLSNIYNVESTGTFDYSTYDYDYYYGVRPLVTIASSMI